MFTIHTKSGKYLVQVRGRFVKSITSEKKLLVAIQNTINGYRKMKNISWHIIADRYQELLDEKDIHRIASDWGMFNHIEKVK